MSKKFRRGAIGILGAAVMTLTLAPMASADVVDPDPDFNVQPAVGTNVYRFSGSDRIATAISAAQSRDDWGRWSAPGGLYWECDTWTPMHDSPVHGSFEAGDTIQTYWFQGFNPIEVTCTATENTAERKGVLDIIVARSDDYSDALAATPLADVLDAPVLINPTNSLDPRNAAEIERLADLDGRFKVTVHLLGGTNALSHGVENSIDALDGVDRTFRYQGIDRFETATNIARVTVSVYGIDSGATLRNVNAYITTGVNFPDALAAGAAAAANDGVVLLTNGEQLDNRGFTDQFLIDLNNWVRDDEGPFRHINTTENFAVGGPAVRAAAANDIRVVENYDGADRYETAVLVAEDTFSPKYGIVNTDHFAVVSGTTYADALVASAYIANADGPLLLSNPGHLNAYTKAYLEDIVQPADKVFTFGGPGALAPSVSQEIADLFVY